RSGGCGGRPRRDERDRRRGAAAAPVALRAVVSDAQRGLAAVARDIRSLASSLGQVTPAHVPNVAPGLSGNVMSSVTYLCRRPAPAGPCLAARTAWSGGGTRPSEPRHTHGTGHGRKRRVGDAQPTAAWMRLLLSRSEPPSRPART